MIFLKIYEWALRLGAPFLKIILKKHARRRGISCARQKELWGKPTQNKKTIHLWGHAVSVGETRSLLTLVDFLAAQCPDWHFLVTTTTATAAQIVENHKANYITHQFFPFDVPMWVEEFLDFWNPASIIFMEQEIWPNLIQACRKRGIHMGLINGSITERSVNRWKKISSAAQYLMDSFHIILAQSQQSLQRFQSICSDPEKVIFKGNLKLAAAPLRENSKEILKLTSMIQNRPFWLAASLHVGEEPIILKAHKIISCDFPSVLTILVPRHINMRLKYQEACEKEGLKYALRSQNDIITSDTQVYIADTLGELGTFYTLTSIAFVGGSLIPEIGGHNPIEAAHLNTAILIGPYTHKCKEIHEEMQISKAICTVHTEKDLAEKVKIWLKDSQALKEAQLASQKFVKSHNPIQEIFSFIKMMVPSQKSIDNLSSKNTG